MITIQFPDEESRTAELQESCGRLFDFSRRLLRYWISADKDKSLNRSNLPPEVLSVALAMSVKASRQFRSAIELCERGETADASIISRSLFEATLVVGFVLKHRFVPREFNADGSIRKRISVPGVALSRRFRALLYLAHIAFGPEHYVKRYQSRPGMKRSVRRMREAAADKIAQEYKQAIGPGWTSILLGRPYTYSGLNIRSLACSLGKPFSWWYDVVYRVQSEHAHAVDALHHMHFDDGGTTLPSWHDSADYVRLILPTAIDMYYATIGMMNKYIDFGIAMNTAIHSFGAGNHSRLSNCSW